MADTPVEVKKATAPAPSRTSTPDVFQSFRNEMDRVFDRFSGNFGFLSLRRMFDVEPWRFEAMGITNPAIDVSEDDKAYKISAELPGLDEKDIDVTVTGDALVLRGEKRHEKEEKEKNYYLSERSYGAFQRAFALPEGIDRNKIDAQFSKGVLTITLPKTAEAQKQAKKITVKAG